MLFSLQWPHHPGPQPQLPRVCAVLYYIAMLNGCVHYQLHVFMCAFFAWRIHNTRYTRSIIPRCGIYSVVSPCPNIVLSINRRSLYNTFASPWADAPCRPQDIGQCVIVLAVQLTTLYFQAPSMPCSNYSWRSRVLHDASRTSARLILSIEHERSLLKRCINWFAATNSFALANY